MKVLFDQGTPAPLREGLLRCEVKTAFECGWQTLTNGDLLTIAEQHGFDVLITTDRNLRYQQNLERRRIAIMVLSTTNWRRIRPHVQLVSDALHGLAVGAFLELAIPEQ